MLSRQPSGERVQLLRFSNKRVKSELHIVAIYVSIYLLHTIASLIVSKAAIVEINNSCSPGELNCRVVSFA